MPHNAVQFKTPKPKQRNINVRSVDSSEHKKSKYNYSSEEDNFSLENTPSVGTIENSEELKATTSTPQSVNMIDSSNEWTSSVQVNHFPILFKLDTRASGNLLTSKDLHSIPGEHEMISATCRLKDYNDGAAFFVVGRDVGSNGVDISAIYGRTLEEDRVSFEPVKARFLSTVGLSQEWKAYTPEEVTAEKGSCVQIACNYSYPLRLTNQPCVGSWRYNKSGTVTTAFHSKDQNVISPTFHHRTRLSGDLNDDNCSLIINNIRRQDAGRYYFRIKFDKKNKYNYKPGTRLQVSAEPSQEWKGETPQQVTAETGLCVQIPCRYSYPSCLGSQSRGGVWFNEESGTSAIAFHSKDDNYALSRFRDRTRLSGDLKDGNCSLIINNIRREDAGPYYFRIEFDNGPSHSYHPVTRLQVSDSPQNLLMTSLDMINVLWINIIEGNSTVIICSVESFPASNLTWRHLHVPRNRTSSNNELWLVIPHVTSRDTGDYEGAAENGHGAVERSITITVEYSPRNLSMSSHDMINASWINVIEGNSTVIICSVESFPAPNLTWRHLNVTMNRTSSNNELWLVIPHVTSRDTGDYECAAENEHGVVEGSITIIVELSGGENLDVILILGIRAVIFIVVVIITVAGICVCERRTVKGSRQTV
ncbi:sialic acid-binding Ig-like lectin 12 [Scyliorhinus torazame]|uniref:sialic acid-binding Ig-like lectin 12 n=1 Tax=Scyliorhinus torazame TaxID=75743 RepID=UPI003B58F39B